MAKHSAPRLVVAKTIENEKVNERKGLGLFASRLVRWQKSFREAISAGIAPLYTPSWST